MRKQKIELSTRPDLLDLVERGIITEDAAREVIMSEKRREEDKRKDELQLLFSAVHKSPITRGKDGRWRTRVPDETGNLRLLAKISLGDIERELRLAYFGDDQIDSERELATLATLYPRWLEKKKNDRDDPISASTIERYESDWKNKIKPESSLVNVPIRCLSEDLLKGWCDRVFDEVSVSYYTNIKTVITGILEYAVKERIISAAENPAAVMIQKNAKRRKRIRAAENGDESEGHEVEVFTPEETAKLEEAALWAARNHQKISNPAIFLGIAFWIHTGLRPAELLGLKPEDLNGSILTVRRMYSYHEDEKDENGKRTRAKVKPWLKTYKMARSFAVDRDAMMIMKECETLKRRMSIRSEYAFSIDDMPVTHNKLMKAVKTCCRIAGVKYRRPYAFRDTWITTLVDSGKFTLAEIADMAGNSPAVIMQHYYGNRRTVMNDTDYMTDALKGLKYRNKKCSEV